MNLTYGSMSSLSEIVSPISGSMWSAAGIVDTTGTAVEHSQAGGRLGTS